VDDAKWHETIACHDDYPLMQEKIETAHGSRDAGYYWVDILGDIEIARWDSTGNAWHLIGTDEGADLETVKVLYGPLHLPAVS
jgi:hypothetical protein